MNKTHLVNTICRPILVHSNTEQLNNKKQGQKKKAHHTAYTLNCRGQGINNVISRDFHQSEGQSQALITQSFSSCWCNKTKFLPPKQNKRCSNIWLVRDTSSSSCSFRRVNVSKLLLPFKRVGIKRSRVSARYWYTHKWTCSSDCWSQMVGWTPLLSAPQASVAKKPSLSFHQASCRKGLGNWDLTPSSGWAVSCPNRLVDGIVGSSWARVGVTLLKSVRSFDWPGMVQLIIIRMM